MLNYFMLISNLFGTASHLVYVLLAAYLRFTCSQVKLKSKLYLG